MCVAQNLHSQISDVLFSDLYLRMLTKSTKSKSTIVLEVGYLILCFQRVSGGIKNIIGLCLESSMRKIGRRTLYFHLFALCCYEQSHDPLSLDFSTEPLLRKQKLVFIFGYKAYASGYQIKKNEMDKTCGTYVCGAAEIMKGVGGDI